MASGSPQTQTAHLAFSAGLDERTHPRHLQPPRLKRCENARFTRAGALSKRPGNDVVSASEAGPVRLLDHRDELLELDALGLRSFSATNGVFESKGEVHEAVPSLQHVASALATVVAPDVAIAGGLEAYIWSDATSISNSGNLYCVVRDLTTGTAIQSGLIVNTANYPRLVAVGSAIIMVYAVGGGSANIAARVLASDGRTWGAASNVITDNASSFFFDVATNGTNFYVLYRTSANALRCRSFNTSLALQATVTSAETSTTFSPLGLTVTVGERVWAVYSDFVGGSYIARAAAFAENLSSETVAPFTIYSDATEAIGLGSVIRVTSTTACAVLSAANGDGFAVLCPVFSASQVLVGSATATNRRTYWCQAASKPFTQGGRFYAWLYVGGTRWTAPTPPTEQLLQYTLMLVDLGAHDTSTTKVRVRPVCSDANRYSFPLSVATLTSPQVCSSNAQSPSTGKWKCAALVLRSNNGRVGVVAAQADFVSVSRGAPATTHGSTFLAPGSSYDGVILSEPNFTYWPQQVSIPSYTTGGSLVVGKRYRWRVVFVWADSAGQIHRSAPSDYVESTATDTKANIKYPQLCVGAAAKLDYVGVEIYRTTADPTDDTPYYLVTTRGNNPVVATVTDTEGAADTTIAKNEQIYTQGGALRRQQPPGFAAVATYRGRVWGANGHTLWYSGAFVDGEAAWWNDAFQQPLDTTEDVTAMWVMDDTLYVSTASRIYYLQAEGPTDTGALNDVGIPMRVATDLGCIDQRSVVVTPIGTLYQSAVGIHLLDRGRQVPPQVFGLRVQDTLATYPTIVAAIVHPSGGYVLFFCTNGTTSVRIVYDYTADEWATDTSGLFRAFSGATVSRRTVHWMNDTIIYKENATYLDDGDWVVRTVEFADFHPTGVQGLMKLIRAKLGCDRLTSHGHTVYFAKDYASSYFDSRAWTDAELDALALEQFDVVPKDQRCQAMRVKIVDAAPTTGSLGTGRGCDLIALALDFDPLGNQFQLPAAARK